MAVIHETAIVACGAQLGEDVKIGPYSIIGENVIIGDNTEVKSHVVIDGYTSIGSGNVIYPFAAIGLAPQDLKYNGEKSTLEIGNNNKIREYVTIHPGTTAGGMKTVVGSNCLFMASAHIAHDCTVGDYVIMANNATIAGHVVVGNHVVIGGLSAVHQFVRIGDYSIIGGMTGIARDLVPYSSSFSDHDKIKGVNIIGLKRAGFSNSDILLIQKVFDKLFFENSSIPFSEKVDAVKNQYGGMDKIDKIIDFLQCKSKRSFVQG